MNKVFVACILAVVFFACCKGTAEKPVVDDEVETVAEGAGADSCVDVGGEKDSVREENQGYEYQDQRELNDLHGTWMLEYNDSIEREFQQLLVLLPQYRDVFNKEKKYWKRYQKGVRELAGCEDHGSSTPMFVDDMLNQGISLREASFRNLYLHMQGKRTSFSKTRFTSGMISRAYRIFIKVAGDDEYNDYRTDYQENLRKEWQLWNEWMNYRRQVSEQLSDELKVVYDNCTNQTMRTKLLQLKNQNKGLGMIGGDVLDCLLADDCTDKALLNYPGFNVVWEKRQYVPMGPDSVNDDKL